MTDYLFKNYCSWTQLNSNYLIFSSFTQLNFKSNSLPNIQISPGIHLDPLSIDHHRPGAVKKPPMKPDVKYPDFSC